MLASSIAEDVGALCRENGEPVSGDVFKKRKEDFHPGGPFVIVESVECSTDSVRTAQFRTFRKDLDKESRYRFMFRWILLNKMFFPDISLQLSSQRYHFGSAQRFGMAGSRIRQPHHGVLELK